MADYSIAELLGALQGAGYSGAGLYIQAAISLAENGARKLTAVNTAGNTPAGSRDRGPFQINDYWHADVPDACAFDLACSAKAAFKISAGGTSFGAWSTYNSGAYLKTLPEVQGVTPAPPSSVAASSAPAATPAGFSIGSIPGVSTITDAVKNVVTSVFGDFIAAMGKVALQGVLIAGGVGLVAIGAYRAVAPVRSSSGVVVKTAAKAAVA